MMIGGTFETYICGRVDPEGLYLVELLEVWGSTVTGLMATRTPHAEGMLKFGKYMVVDLAEDMDRPKTDRVLTEERFVQRIRSRR